MQSYYEILDIEYTATSSEIKRAFRQKAKKLHPDLQASARDSAEEMRQLLGAYKTLINPSTRREYDRLNRIAAKEHKFDYRVFLRDQNSDESRSKLIFFDLLHSHEEEAVRLYDILVRTKDFDLSKNLDREDFMDCAFLLAEEYEENSEYVKAYQLLKTILDYEREKPYFKHFIVEVTDRMKTITCNKMPGVIESERLLDFLKELINYGFSRKDTAFFYKKSAEIYLDIERYDLAIYYLKKCLALDKKVNGIKKLKERINRIERIHN